MSSARKCQINLSEDPKLYGDCLNGKAGCAVAAGSSAGKTEGPVDGDNHHN